MRISAILHTFTTTFRVMCKAYKFYHIYVCICVCLLNRDQNANSKLRIVYTAMHGVGFPYALQAFKAFNLAEPIPVTEQVNSSCKI